MSNENLEMEKQMQEITQVNSTDLIDELMMRSKKRKIITIVSIVAACICFIGVLVGASIAQKKASAEENYSVINELYERKDYSSALSEIVKFNEVRAEDNKKITEKVNQLYKNIEEDLYKQAKNELSQEACDIYLQYYKDGKYIKEINTAQEEIKKKEKRDIAFEYEQKRAEFNEFVQIADMDDDNDFEKMRKLSETLIECMSNIKQSYPEGFDYTDSDGQKKHLAVDDIFEKQLASAKHMRAKIFWTDGEKTSAISLLEDIIKNKKLYGSGEDVPLFIQAVEEHLEYMNSNNKALVNLDDFVKRHDNILKEENLAKFENLGEELLYLEDGFENSVSKNEETLPMSDYYSTVDKRYRYNVGTGPVGEYTSVDILTDSENDVLYIGYKMFVTSMENSQQMSYLFHAKSAVVFASITNKQIEESYDTLTEAWNNALDGNASNDILSCGDYEYFFSNSSDRKYTVFVIRAKIDN